MIAEPKDDAKETIAQARRLLAIGKPPLWTLIAIPATIVVTAALSVLPPQFIGNMIDALQHRNSSATVHQLVLYMVVTLVFGALGLASNYSSSILRETFTRNLQLNLIAKLNRARFDALSALTFGQLTNRAVGDPRALCTQLENSFFPTISSVCLLVATIVAMTRIDYRLALVALAFALLVFFPLRMVGPRIVATQRRLAKAGDEFFGAVAESGSLEGLAMFRNGNAARQKQRRLEDMTANMFRMRVKQVVIGGVASVASTMTNTIGPAAVMALGAYLAAHGQISVGAIVTILIYQSRMPGPLGALSQLQVSIATIGVLTRRLLEIADLPEERSGSLPFVPGAIRWEGVRAANDGCDVLADINLTLERGAHVALVGPSGAGKSSLATLVTRLREPYAGTISIAGVNVTDISLESLRSAVCLVAQEPFILDATIRENLTLKAPHADPPAVDRAVAMTRLTDMLAQLPQGLETPVGQRGFRLSGGERQRICLARALLASPEVLILDEALTGVDIGMERKILEDIRAEYAGRTLVVITHRLESVARFDRVVVMNAGSVVAQDTADEYFAAGRYAVAGAL
jgi:ATP-binding cassette, subfamily B, bacterial